MISLLITIGKMYFLKEKRKPVLLTRTCLPALAEHVRTLGHRLKNCWQVHHTDGGIDMYLMHPPPKSAGAPRFFNALLARSRRHSEKSIVLVPGRYLQIEGSFVDVLNGSYCAVSLRYPRFQLRIPSKLLISRVWLSSSASVSKTRMDIASLRTLLLQKNITIFLRRLTSRVNKMMIEAMSP